MNMIERNAILKDNNYKLVAYNNETTGNEIILLNDSDKEHYRDLIINNQDKIECGKNFSECWVCNHKIVNKYFVCDCDNNDSKVIGGSK